MDKNIEKEIKEDIKKGRMNLKRYKQHKEVFKKLQQDSIKKTIKSKRISFLDKDLRKEYESYLIARKILSMEIYFGGKTKEKFGQLKAYEEVGFRIIQESHLREQKRINNKMLIFTVGMFILVVFQIIIYLNLPQ